ncbi:PTS sugar transporter subunit IIA [Caproiciproducens sp. MSJ-32]|nr:PTS sugar transporter subunit IIA [Caproiciproducens sp. MSJ-32]
MLQFKIKQKLKNKEEVINFMALKLLERGYINSSYCKTVLERELVSSTSIGNGVALPHGDPNNILMSSISFMTLENPIIWGEEEVELIILISMKKEDVSKYNLRDFFEILKITHENDCLRFLSYFSDAYKI